ncbi:MAG: acyltransferase family protein, partial [Cyanobium sp.]
MGRPAGSYRPDIDGLRAVAVLAVILFHFNEKLLHSGFLGVDVFFVISGFVISASLARRQE